MASIGVLDIDGKEVGSVDLPESVFGIEPSSDAVYYVVKAHLTNQRQGNASTKTRAEVDLTKKKMYRQKGTGRARKGTAGSPILVGGGIAHGPKPHDFHERVPKKVKRLAMRSAFSQKAIDEAVRVLQDFDLDTPKTKRMSQMTYHLNVQNQKTLLLTAEKSDNVVKSCQNIPRLSILPITQVSTYDVIHAETLILTQGALARIESMWGGA
jgi:large subunit ribosomal protein L4